MTALAVLCTALTGVSSEASVGPAISSQDLGSIAVGTSTTLTFQISGLASIPSFAPHYGTEFSLGQTSCGNTAPISCTITVQFTPQYPGLRQDAINVFGSNGTLAAVALLHGIGLGPRALLRPGILNDFAGDGEFAEFNNNGDNGPAISAMLSNPQGVAVDNNGNVYISDSLEQVVRRVDAATGIITTIAGGGTVSGSNIGDGGPATSGVLNAPCGLALDGAGNLYIADSQNNRVRRVDAQTQIITTVAGNGTLSTTTNLGNGGAATAASLYGPVDVALDGAGNLYIADEYNYMIRRVDAVTGVIMTVAGGGTNPGGTDGLGDGGVATAAILGAPAAIALDAAGNLYIADSSYDVIRKVSAGLITVVAGTVGAGSFNEPNGLRVDAAGNLYVSDTNNSVLWEVNGAGMMFVLAGQTGQDGYNGDGVLASQAELSFPYGIALDASGNIYIADQGNARVRKLVAGPAALTFAATSVGSVSSPQTVSIDNIGNQALSFSAFGITGNFVQQSSGQIDCGLGITVPGATSCLAAVALAPQASGVLSGALSWQTNAQTAATVLALSGMGGASTGPALNSSVLLFANQPGGTPSAAQTITLTNYSTSTVNNPGASISGTNASDFSTTSTCGSSLAPNASCTISVTFTPGASGTRVATLTALEADSSNNQLSQVASLQGTGTAAPALTTSPTVQFGAQVLGVTSAAQTVTLTNSSSGSMAIASAVLSGPSDFSITGNTCGTTLGANSSCSVSVTFTPTALGAEQATVQFTDAGGNSPQSVTLQGTGVPVPALQLAGGASSVNVGMAPLGGAVSLTLTFSNTSPAAYSITAVTVNGANSSEFTVSNACGTSVVSGASCTVAVTFRPSVAGMRAALLSIGGSNALETSVNVALSGTALAQTTFGAAKAGDVRASGDFDGDGISDFVVWRPVNGTWYVIPSSHPGSLLAQQWGLPGDIPVPADYDGDGKTDFAVWRPSNGTWYVIPSSHPGSLFIQQWGLAGDVPVPGDYDGDGKTDFAVWRPSNGTWYVIPSSHPGSLLIQQWGLAGDVPVPGDYDGDGKADLAIWRPSNGTWFVLSVTQLQHYPVPTIAQQWGLSGDIPVPGDYDGDGKTDFAIWRPANGTWFVLTMSGVQHYPFPTIMHQWGLPSDIPVPGDYNGDGKLDFAIWRPANGTWFSLFSGAMSSYPAPSQMQQWGLPGDVPR